MLKKWQDLNDSTKQEVKRAYIHWHYDTTSQTFSEWANKHAFYVTKNGKLDDRYHHCEPEFLA